MMLSTSIWLVGGRHGGPGEGEQEASNCCSVSGQNVELRGGYAVLLPEPQDYSQRLRGLHREIWEGVEPQEYVRQERDAWRT
jgi:hypothetical protein